MTDTRRIHIIVEAIGEISSAQKKLRGAIKGVENEYLEVALFCLSSYTLGTDFLIKFEQRIQNVITKTEFDHIIKDLRKEFPDDINN